jgi:2,4-dienoyl-CoA reductase-like NADH-dependent reductase (Old Yellow Enzyme family)
MEPVGPGNIRLDLPAFAFGNPRPLKVDELMEIKEKFVYAAKVCQETGFDGIQIHSAHGYLLSSFLNPLANNRPELFGEGDKYGGELANRARLLLVMDDVHYYRCFYHLINYFPYHS